jgi:hypothetical protein
MKDGSLGRSSAIVSARPPVVIELGESLSTWPLRLLGGVHTSKFRGNRCSRSLIRTVDSTKLVLAGPQGPDKLDTAIPKNRSFSPFFYEKVRNETVASHVTVRLAARLRSNLRLPNRRPPCHGP